MSGDRPICPASPPGQLVLGQAAARGIAAAFALVDPVSNAPRASTQSEALGYSFGTRSGIIFGTKRVGC